MTNERAVISAVAVLAATMWITGVVTTVAVDTDSYRLFKALAVTTPLPIVCVSAVLLVCAPWSSLWLHLSAPWGVGLAVCAGALAVQALREWTDLLREFPIDPGPYQFHDVPLAMLAPCALLVVSASSIIHRPGRRVRFVRRRLDVLPLVGMVVLLLYALGESLIFEYGIESDDTVHGLPAQASASLAMALVLTYSVVVLLRRDAAAVPAARARYGVNTSWVATAPKIVTSAPPGT